MEKFLKILMSYNPQKFELINDLIEEGHDSTRGIFVNRTLKMDDIKYIGFDMDYTLAIYNKIEIEKLAFDLSIEKLITTKGYPEFIRNINYDPSYVIRGLLIDKNRGNVLKIDRHKSVRRADHGTRSLSAKEIRDIYINGRIKQSDGGFNSVDTLFSLPEAYMFAKMVDAMDDGSLQIESYAKLFDDVRLCIDTVHRDGSLKGEIAKDLQKYIYKDPRLPLVLDKFREKGKKLFVLTNSEWSYTNIVMNFLLENTMLEYKNWEDFFDIIICHASKPEFFVKGKDFVEINQETNQMGEVANQFEKGHVYAYGNYTKFEEIIGAKGDEVLYVGDHIYGDILRSNKDSGWRTVLVVEELEEELAKIHNVYPDTRTLNKLEEKRDKIDYEITIYSNKVKKLKDFKKEKFITLTEKELVLIDQAILDFEENIQTFETRLNKLLLQIASLRKKIDTSFHKKWGPVFQEFDEISRFGDQVRDYACIYTSRLSNFFFYPVNNYFKSLRDIMPHEKFHII
ncbi:MAG: HAD-IG family 5'-nucleotidase [Candidatus Sericytochromatia bacterium]|nr:HAD-IG family 5'-nucleotidase [Candidatus Sericytochromatia bacterium]